MIKTDQKSLKELLEQKLQTPEQQQWLPKFLGYDFTIQYKPGKENIVADSLSRLFAMAWSTPTGLWLQKVKEFLQQDTTLHDLYDKCVNGYLHVSNYSAKNGLLFWKDRLVIPSNDQLKHKIFYELRVNKIGGHARIAKTVAKIASQFYWPHMHTDICRFVSDCSI